MPTHDISRRAFLLVSGTAAGGLAVGVSYAQGGLQASAFAPAGISDATPGLEEVNAWIVIEPDETVLIRLAQSEMGQGVSTGLPQIIAEELECDWSKVRVEYASANRNAREKAYGRMFTVGSMSVRIGRTSLQKAGANARARLVAAAAARWKVDPSSCSAGMGKITHAASLRSITFGKVAGDAAKITLAQEPAIKEPRDYKLIGQPLKRVDTTVKISGAAKFGIDARVPGMAYAAMAMCPVPGGVPKSVNESAIKGRRGVLQVVTLPDAVAVVADNYWRAKQALALLPIEWDFGAGANVQGPQLDKDYRDAAMSAEAANAKKIGDTKAALADAKVVDALYETPYLAHAPMEPLNCTAHVQPDRVDLWMGTQAPDIVVQVAAKTAGVKPENVYLHNCYLGGGFGRRSQTDELIQAVLLSKAAGKPVKLVWSREDDIRNDNYRPQAAVAFKAALSKDNKLAALEARIACGALTATRGRPTTRAAVDSNAVEGLANLPYDIPNLTVDCVVKNTHVPVTYWRSVGASITGYVVEGFIDELAHQAGADPFQFRRAMLAGKNDWIGVLEKAAQKGDWGKALPAGAGRGIAISEAMGSIVAQVAEVSVSQRGQLRVERIVAAYDCGHVVNPQLVEAQISGGIVFGLTAALYGEITVKDGAIEQGNFDAYKMVRLADCPLIEVHPALSGGGKWGGVGEPSVPTTASAVCNAVFAATGKRIRRLPLKNADLTHA